MDEAAAGKVPPIAPGARIDRYELVLLVREDDAGSVWLARENAPAKAERLVALRFASAKLAEDTRFRELLRQHGLGKSDLLALVAVSVCLTGAAAAFTSAHSPLCQVLQTARFG